MAVDITSVEYSDWLVRKVNARKGCTIDDVFDAIENASKAVWNDDPDHGGLRLFLFGYTEQGKPLRIILFPIEGEHGAFRLGTVIEDQ